MLENGYEKNECETKPSASTSISETAVSWDTHPLVLGVLPYLELQIILWKRVISDKSVHRYNYPLQLSQQPDDLHCKWCRGWISYCMHISQKMNLKKNYKTEIFVNWLVTPYPIFGRLSVSTGIFHKLEIKESIAVNANTLNPILTFFLLWKIILYIE